MKLLLFVHSLRCGGAERVTASLANHWVEKGWEVTVVTLAPAADDFYELHPGVTRIALELAEESAGLFTGARNNLRRIVALRRVLRSRRPDVAVAMINTANVLLALASRGIPGMITIGAEHSFPPRMPMGFLWEQLRRFSYGQLSAVTALTSECVAWVRANTRASRVELIPNAALWPLPAQRPVVRPADFLSPGQRVLLAVGRLAEEKQFEHLVAIFAPLAGAHADWVLVILGDGSLRPALERQVEALALQGRVLLPGRVGNVGDWYESAELYAMTSRFEGFPNTLAEAMAYGLPGISYDCDTGPRDLIRHEVDGFLVAPGDRSAFASALRRLMGNEALRDGFARHAVEVRERFSQTHISGLWERLFADLLRLRK